MILKIDERRRNIVVSRRVISRTSGPRSAST